MVRSTGKRQEQYYSWIIESWRKVPIVAFVFVFFLLLGSLFFLFGRFAVLVWIWSTQSIGNSNSIRNQFCLAGTRLCIQSPAGPCASMLSMEIRHQHWKWKVTTMTGQQIFWQLWFLRKQQTSSNFSLMCTDQCICVCVSQLKWLNSNRKTCSQFDLRLWCLDMFGFVLWLLLYRYSWFCYIENAVEQRSSKSW